MVYKNKREKEIIFDLYFNMEMSIEEIANELGYVYNTIAKVINVIKKWDNTNMNYLKTLNEIS